MSDVLSSGYGSTHDWKRGNTCAARVTDYRCRRCGRVFSHWYAKQPDIAEAMRAANIGECPAVEEMA